MNTLFPRKLTKLGRRRVWRLAILLLTAALALPAEHNVSGAPALQRSEAAKPNRKPAFRALGKVNPLRLLEQLDTATTDLAIRFSSWHSDLPGSQELPKAKKALDAESEVAAPEQSEHAGGSQGTCQTDGESFEE